VITEIVQWVEAWDADGEPILDLCYQSYLTEEQLYMADVFKSLSGDGKAKIRREITETLGGPRYSSIKVTTSIELTCDQSQPVIRRAAKEAMAEVQILNEEALTVSWEKLREHVKDTDWT
jgi:hypothetical protein